MKLVNVSTKTFAHTKRMNVGILAHLESIADTSVIVYDEILSFLDIVPTQMTNKKTKNGSIKSDDKKERWKTDCCIFYTILLVIILLLIVIVICYHYAKYRSKKGINAH